MWRVGFTNPVNYNDNEVFCGGVGVQLKNGWKCGVCGDNHDKKQPRLHEGGGKYGNGIIGRRYAMGQNITLNVELTTNHWGYFEMKLCPLNHRGKVATQRCMDRHPLALADDPNQYKFYIPEGSKKSEHFQYTVSLPAGLTCQQCVVQWTYTTGNTWGKCDNGTEVVGCGPQETFRNCADVQIFSNVPTGFLQRLELPSAIYVTKEDRLTGRKKAFPFVVKHAICVPTEAYTNESNMAEWCQVNCLRYPPNCPADKCTCLKSCKAIGRLAGVQGTDVYCHRRCLRYPSDCPKDECQCYAEDDDNSGEEDINTVTDEELQGAIVQSPGDGDDDSEEPYIFNGQRRKIVPGIIEL